MEIKGVNILENLGFSKRDAKTYLILLELGSSTIGDIVKRTEIPSSKIYEVLDKLISKGLVSYVIIKNQKHFRASDPEIILNDFNEKGENFKKLLPSLKEKQKSTKNKQEVELYEGKQAIFRMIRLIVEQANKDDEYLSFSLGNEHSDPEISLFLSNLALRRKEKGLKMKTLSNNKFKDLIKNQYGEKILKTINNRFTSFDYPQGIIILNDNLIITNWIDRPTAIKIISKNIVEKYKTFFYELYNKARA